MSDLGLLRTGRGLWSTVDERSSLLSGHQQNQPAAGVTHDEFPPTDFRLPDWIPPQERKNNPASDSGPLTSLETPVRCDSSSRPETQSCTLSDSVKEHVSETVDKLKTSSQPEQFGNAGVL